MKKLRKILLVDNDARDIELTLEALKDSNLANRVVVLNDGASVIDYLKYEGRFQNRKRENPAVILLDIKMPCMDGLEVLEIIRKDKKLKFIPVVMMTSSREEPDLKRCYEIGVNAYVVKPVDFEEFIKAVRYVGAFWAVLNELPDDSE
ncbi:MAG: response regulator [Fidelibacterota bacterium]